ncbi:MAG: V-type ATP synthase subunit C [Clostridiaceae bacterium]|nr:V-type ATP synthase subunit C [Clostridiaceae bacterium]
MTKINRDDYAYAAGLIRAKEIRLLDSDRLNRMIEAPDAAEAFKVLTEAEYGYGNTENFYSFEQVLAEEMKKTYDLLAEIAPVPEVVDAFKRKYDYFNIKVLLKAEFSGQEPPQILMDTGVFGAEQIKRIIRERDYNDLSPVMIQAITDTYDAFSRMRDPQAVDLIIDKASYDQFVNDLNEFDSPFLNELARIIIDITNIKMYIRARGLNKSWDFIRKLLLKGGEISEEFYFTEFDKPIEAFVDDLRQTKYGDMVKRGWEMYIAKKNISGLEKLLDDFLMRYIRRAKLITMGVEPFIAYLFAKETEIRNVRIIMTGKINGLNDDLIRERLRLGYV